MSNPVLNESTFQRASTWAPPAPSYDGYPTPTVDGQRGHGRVSDGPSSTWQPRPMTINGTLTATATLLVLLLAAGAVGWLMTDEIQYDAFGNARFSLPMMAWVGMVVGIGLTFLLYFKPRLAKFVAPAYAIAEGFFIGALSKAYENFYDGIVVQAVGATIAVFAVMLVLYATRIITVTQRMRSIIVSATLGIMVFYGIALLLRLFGVSVGFLSSSSALGIGFSVLVSALAAFNLLLDFDFIERGVARRLDKNFEWYAAFGLVVTLVWLYLELLRLLSKLRER